MIKHSSLRNIFLINTINLGLMRQKYRDSPAMAAPRLADTSTSLQSRAEEDTEVIIEDIEDEISSKH